jgi:hypothetical protein
MRFSAAMADDDVQDCVGVGRVADFVGIVAPPSFRLDQMRE